MYYALIKITLELQFEINYIFKKKDFLKCSKMEIFHLIAKGHLLMLQ